MQRRQLLSCATAALLSGAGAVQAQHDASLNAAAVRTGRRFGFAIDPSYADKEPVKSLLLQHAGVITAENAMKWRNMLNPLGIADYTHADRIADTAKNLNALLRGHTLAWHQSTPGYLSNASNDVFVSALTSHVRALTTRYRGRIHTWDVLNEVIEPDHRRSDGLRESVLSKLWGADNYPALFELARAADPQAKLAYNDYGMEQDTPSSERRRSVMLRTLERWIARKTPIDVLGLQAHLDLSRPFSATKFHRFLDELQAFGLTVQITELDIRDPQFLGGVAVRDAALATLYKDFCNACLNHPAVEMVVMWNVTDADSWVNRWTQGQRRADGTPMRPTLFDAQGQGKLALAEVLQSFQLATIKFETKETKRV
jgi:endo-1,4-beta-xylanase